MRSICKDKQNGIILIALIITIIVMLILLAVTVKTAVDSGLFGHAKEGIEKWGDAEKKELEGIDNISATIDAITNDEIDYPPTSPIYARFYEDGTFILSGTDYIDSSKTLSKDYGDISAKKYHWDIEIGNLPEWANDPITNVLVYDKIQPVNTVCWFFRGCGEEGQDTIQSMDLRNLDTSKVKNMMDMFSFCNNLTSLDVSNFDTRNVTTMYEMFGYCKKLENIDVSNFDTQNVTDMGRMFDYCNSLKMIDLSKFDTKNVTNMRWMFSNCWSLTELDISSFDMQNVTDILGMFGAISANKVYVKDEATKEKITEEISELEHECEIIIKP